MTSGWKGRRRCRPRATPASDRYALARTFAHPNAAPAPRQRPRGSRQPRRAPFPAQRPRRASPARSSTAASRTPTTAFRAAGRSTAANCRRHRGTIAAAAIRARCAALPTRRSGPTSPSRSPAGSAYEFDVYVLLDDPAAREAFLRISWYASDDASGSAIAVSDSPARLTGSDPSFRYLTTGPALAPQTARSARFRIMLAPASSAPATIYLDDASLQEVAPELAATPAPPPPAGEDEPDVDATEPAGARTQQVQPEYGRTAPSRDRANRPTR